jgi:sugar lactone lactonase YvrE
MECQRSWFAGFILVTALASVTARAATLPDVITIPGEKIYPESITSRADGTLIIGSIGAKTIWQVKPGADTAEPWINPGTDDMQSIYGVLADPKSNTLWACSNVTRPPGTPPTSPGVLYAFDLKSGAPKGHWALPTEGAFCNDIAVGSDGTAYVSDSANMEVDALKKGGKAMEVWAGNGAFGPKGAVLDGIAVLGKRVIPNALSTSKLFSVPIERGGKAGAVTELQLDTPIERPDGHRAFGKNSLLVVESGGGGKLSKVTISGNTAKVTRLKEGFPDGPVSVAVVGTKGYVLEGQLAARRAPPGSEPPVKPFHATAVEVGKP